MKKALLIWQIPCIPGEKYGPLMYFVHNRKAKWFKKEFEEYCLKNNMQWELELDDTAADFEKLSGRNIDLFILVPGAKMRSWLYKKDMNDCGVPLYYLNSIEYSNGEIENIKELML